MNCTTCRHELSQCLDGRLPSGRRALVLQHTEKCAECARFRDELHAAQQLVARLSAPRVGADFREQLWERIRAGEGTPEAVFREPVGWMVKARYALSGAAAAAALLLGTVLVRDGLRTRPNDAERLTATANPTTEQPAIASTNDGATGLVPRQPRAELATLDAPLEAPLFATAQRLTFDLVAVEAARQFEQRYAAATGAVRRLERAPEAAGRERAVRQAIQNAEELHAFGELLLDLRERRRLHFIDNEVDADLRFAMNLLGQPQLQQGDAETVRVLVAPALRSSRLGSVSRTIALSPTLDPREETDALVRLSTTRPEVFPKLFIVLGTQDRNDPLGLPHGDVAFLLPDECGVSWVAPRSEVEARDALQRLVRGRLGERGEIRVQVEVRPRGGN